MFQMQECVWYLHLKYIFHIILQVILVELPHADIDYGNRLSRIPTGVSHSYVAVFE